jgi:hypothetical protein
MAVGDDLIPEIYCDLSHQLFGDATAPQQPYTQFCITRVSA